MITNVTLYIKDLSGVLSTRDTTVDKLGFPYQSVHDDLQGGKSNEWVRYSGQCRYKLITGKVVGMKALWYNDVIALFHSVIDQNAFRMESFSPEIQC